MKEIILSPAALEKLKIEMETLKAKRKEMAERIEKAKDFGDLSENFEYHEAKDAWRMNEERIIELEHVIKSAIIQDIRCSGDKVELGATAEVEIDGNKHTFTIVSFNEADPSEGKISNESPIGAALIGHCVGDEVEVEAPSGLVKYKILDVK